MSDENAPGATQSQNTFGMTDLQEALQGDHKHAVAQGVIGRIDLLISVADMKLRTGVAQGQLEPTQKIHHSLVAARGLMLKFSIANT